jgi:predicted HicB family RNase H-like nuclease
MMSYKGYVGRIEFDDEANLFHGEVVNTRDVITFQGKSVDEIRSAFLESVDDYLAFCEERGEPAENPCSGRLLTRISPQLHRQLSVAAAAEGTSLNHWVAERLQQAVQASLPRQPVRRNRRRDRAPKSAR